MHYNYSQSLSINASLVYESSLILELKEKKISFLFRNDFETGIIFPPLISSFKRKLNRKEAEFHELKLTVTDEELSVFS